jgi:MoxR-like ATPase
MTNNTEILKKVLHQTKQEMAKVIIGHEHVIDQALIAIFSGHHALIEGVPGVAKTLLVRSLAHVLGCDFSRIQFTPDLMPTDITGTNVFNLQKNMFSLLKGPIFSALLQAMQERTVTIDRKTYTLSPNFTVFATQNPIEYEGTYPLPEAQKDRFMLKIAMDHPAREEEMLLAQRMLGNNSPEQTLASGAVKQTIAPETLARLQQTLVGITVKEDLLTYIVDIVRKTRTHQSVLVGAGPRATQALLLAARTFAALKERDFVTPDDIKSMAVPVFDHRLILRPEYEIEGLAVGEVIENILKEVTVPR